MSNETKNRFGNLIDANRARQAEQAELETSTPQVNEPPPAPKAVTSQKRGGKSSDPDYRHLSAYIRRDTHQQAYRKLLDEGKQRDLSDVLEELLGGWVKS